MVKEFKKNNIRTSLFIEAERSQVIVMKLALTLSNFTLVLTLLRAVGIKTKANLSFFKFFDKAASFD